MKKSKIYIGLVLIFIVSCVASKFTKTYLIAKNESDFDFLKNIPVLMEDPDTIIKYRWIDKKGIHNVSNKPPTDYEYKTDTISTNRYYKYLTYNFRGFELSDWQRDSKNMIFIHNAIKKIGYKKFISSLDYYKTFESWENTYSINNYIDSLLNHYDNQDVDTSNYYYKFWLRRQHDQTDKALICILRDIKEIYTGKSSDCEVPYFTNDTISRLIEYDYKLGHLNSYKNQESGLVYSYFDYLKSIGLEISAFNLIEHVDFLDLIQINRDSLILTIKHDTVSKSEWTDLYDWDGQGKWIYKKFYWGP
jgi:hypothetical protein